MTMTKKMEAVLRYIPEGYRRAVTLARLATLTGMGERDIKEQVQLLRKAGQPIISMAAGGYFLPAPNSPEDAEIANRYILMMNAQATERLATARAVSNWLEDNASRQVMIPWEV